MRVTDLYRHPVKSVGVEALPDVALRAGAPFPADRVYAVTHAATSFDPDAPPDWARCVNFLRVANSPKLAQVRVQSAGPEGPLRFEAADHPAGPLAADLTTQEGRAAFEAWVAPLVGAGAEGPFRLIKAPGGAMTDLPTQGLSVYSRASLRALGQELGAELDPRRFRGNLWLDGEDVEPFSEEAWIGRRLRLGAAEIEIVEPIDRCMATAACPETGARDVFPARALKKRGDPPCFGLVARVVQSGLVRIGDAATLA